MNYFPKALLCMPRQLPLEAVACERPPAHQKPLLFLFVFCFLSLWPLSLSLFNSTNKGWNTLVRLLSWSAIFEFLFVCCFSLALAASWPLSLSLFNIMYEQRLINLDRSCCIVVCPINQRALHIIIFLRELLSKSSVVYAPTTPS
jgi:hypothetical protein